MRIASFVGIVFVGWALGAGPAACKPSPAAGAALASVRELTLDLPEVSGLARGPLGDGEAIYAVGDSARDLVVVPLKNGEPDLGHIRTVRLPIVMGSHGSQLEAVAVHGKEIWVLAEEDPSAVTIVTLPATDDAPAAKVAELSLVVPPQHPLARAWAEEPNARGEGLIVADDGQSVLVAKQKDPAAIMRFDRRDGQLVAGATWTVALDDLNELARGPDGALYGVGHAGTLCRFAALVEDGGDAPCTATWQMPGDLGGKKAPKWEGLAFLGDGRLFAAADRHGEKHANVALLPALPPVVP